MNMLPRLPQSTALLGTAAAYALLGLLTISYFSRQGIASIFYLPSGVALAALLLGGRRYAGAVFLGSLLLELYVVGQVWPSILMAGGATLGAMLGARLIQRDGRFDIRLSGVDDLFRLGLAGLISATISAAIGTTALLQAGRLASNGYLSAFADWWMGDLIGITLLTPLILTGQTLSAASFRSLSWSRAAEGALVFGLGIVFSGFIFLDWGHPQDKSAVHDLVNVLALPYWTLLCMLWAALRLGTFATMLLVTIIVMMGITGIMGGKGAFNFYADMAPFAHWFYAMVLSLCGMALAGFMDENRRLNQRLLEKQRATEDELQISLSTLLLHDEALNQISQGVMITDMKHRITYVNREFARITGYLAEEMLGQSWNYLNGPNTDGELLSQMCAALDAAQPFHGEFLHYRKDGTPFWNALSIAPVVNAQGDVGQFVAVSSDITAQRKVRTELNTYLAALDQHAIVSATDIQGRIFSVNAKFCEISGYARDELLGQDHRILNSGLHPKEFFVDMYRTLAARQVWHGQIRNRKKDGEHYWVQVTITPFMDIFGKPESYVAIRTDITRQKMIEAQLANNARELQSAHRQLQADHQQLIDLKKLSEQSHRQLLQAEKMSSIGHLAAGVAHEINNPIGFVNSNFGTLGRYIDDLMPFVELGATTPAGENLQRNIDLDFLRTDLRDLLAESTEGLQRVRKIVQNLKDFSHVGEAEWQQADLLTGLEQTLTVAWHELKYKAQIQRELSPLPCICCIPAQINQVFLNLLVNAAQSIDGEGIITLRSGVAGEQVWIEIADTGCGMDEATQRKIFDPFFTTKPVGTGTGLGMSISWDIIEKHAGSIEVTSTPGAGTCIRINLPIAGPAGKETTQ
jgi:PAS domain S-box-containing protein